MEMSRFIAWFNDGAPSSPNPLPAITRAAISHLWFESIHNFEDGNGRIERAIAEKALAQNLAAPTLTALPETIHRHRKAYYAALQLASQSNNIDAWLAWFADIVIEAQTRTITRIRFLIDKTRLLDRPRGAINERQEKAQLRLFREGPDGFDGGLSAENYRTITGASLATVIRDLADLVEKGALGVARNTRWPGSSRAAFEEQSNARVVGKSDLHRRPPMTNSPVRFDPSVEKPSKGEAEAIADLKKSFTHILETTSTDYGHAVRGVHAKGHGIVRGTFTVGTGLPPELAQGLFASAGQYEAILRLSTAPGDILEDAVSAPRGIALKILGVPGERLGHEDAGEQDFLMVNGPVFGAPDPATFAKNLKLLAATTDKAEGAKKALSATLRVIEGAIEAVGLSSSLVTQLGGAPEVHPLGEIYFSQTAYRYGDNIAKFSLKPVSPGLTERTGDKVDVHDRPNALREDVSEVIIEQGGTWELQVQLCTDLEKMPVEDPTVLWNEEQSPFVTVATFVVQPQLSWTNGLSQSQEDLLSFSPWHGLAAHQPLGSVNRARRETYDFSADFRGDFNKCPVNAVKMLDDLPS